MRHLLEGMIWRTASPSRIAAAADVVVAVVAGLERFEYIVVCVFAVAFFCFKNPGKLATVLVVVITAVGAGLANVTLTPLPPIPTTFVLVVLAVSLVALLPDDCCSLSVVVTAVPAAPLECRYVCSMTMSSLLGPCVEYRGE